VAFSISRSKGSKYRFLKITQSDLGYGTYTKNIFHMKTSKLEDISMQRLEVHRSCCDIETESSSTFEIDLFEDLDTVSCQKKGIKEGPCEDRIISKFRLSMQHLGSDESCVMLCVLDGHGGSFCVDYVTSELPKSLEHSLRNCSKRKHSSSENLRDVICKSFESVDSSFLKLARPRDDNSGSTIVACTFFGPNEGRCRLLISSLGDSRAIVFRSLKDEKLIPVIQNPTHKPSHPPERRRVMKEGGEVSTIQGIDRVIKKITSGPRSQSRIGLSVSRAFGDLLMKEPRPIISSVPDFAEIALDFEKDRFLVLGSDGVFDFVTPDEISNNIQRGKSDRCLQSAANRIVDLAKSKGSMDDRTCVIVDFGWVKQAF
jgi:serine/threonine protein phosphatase PrpC